MIAPTRSISVLLLGAFVQSASLPPPRIDDTPEPPKQEWYGRIHRSEQGICVLDTGCAVLAYPCDEKHVSLCQ